MAKKLRSQVSPSQPLLVPGTASTKLEVASFLQRAQAQFQTAAYREARDSARRVLDLDANNADAYHILGAIAFQEKNLDEAETLLAKAISLSRRSSYVRQIGRASCRESRS